MGLLRFSVNNGERQNRLRGGGGGGMVEIFSGTSILSSELGVIGRANTDNLGVLLGPCAQCGPCGYRVQVPKSGSKTKN